MIARNPIESKRTPRRTHKFAELREWHEEKRRSRRKLRQDIALAVLWCAAAAVWAMVLWGKP